MGSHAEIQPVIGKKEDEIFGYAMQLVNGSVLPMTLHTAIQLGVFEIIAKAGHGSKLSPSEIVTKLPTKNLDAPLMLDRVLRLLASHGVLSCSMVGSERVYGLAPVAKYFVPSEDGISLGKVMDLFQDTVFLDSWSQLKGAILDGGVPFERMHGTHVFAHPDPRYNEVFNTAMVNHTTIVMKEILKTYKGFERINQLVDVAGGLGVNLSLITEKYPSIKGINFDLPEVVQFAPQYPGVKHIRGDMFKSVPKADAIFMKWIIHDWDDDDCLKLLKNCYDAIPDDGIVIVVEVVLPNFPETSATSRNKFQFDMLMMAQTHKGKERTQEEFTALATSSGFSGIRFVTCACGFWVMEFYK